MILNILILLLLLQGNFIVGLKYEIPKEQEEKDSSFWYNLGQEDIDFALNRKDITSRAKNIIIFLGDGMGITVTTAGRIYKGQKMGKSGEEESLVWERFPSMGQIKTYNLDRQVPDSAATATAFLGGVKANYFTVGLNGKSPMMDCPASLLESNRVSSVLKWSQEAGKETGFVTSARVTHATPAALYAYTSYRNWESDLKMKETAGTETCKDIARQLVEDKPGKDIKVVFAGGRHPMGVPLEGDTGDANKRNDSRNLVQEWQKDKEMRSASAKYVKNNKEFKDLDLEKTDFMLGLFGGSHMPYSHERDPGPDGTPSLEELTVAAIKRLQRSKDGFFLMVEGGRIDHGLHDSKSRVALEDLIAFEDAVKAALQLVDERETLVIVTADHSHVITINGYPERGNDILGYSKYDKGVLDDLPHTTLMYTNGFGGANYTWDGEKVLRMNLTTVDTRAYDFIAQAAVPMKFGYETHGGEDVAAYAIGPYSHLFHRVHEQSYVAHVMGYAAAIGPYANRKLPDPMQEQDNDSTDKSFSYGVLNRRQKNQRGTGTRITISAILLVLSSVISIFSTM